MRIGDWANGASLLAIGFFLGLAVYYMAQLVGTAFWPMIIIIPVLFGGIFLAQLVLDWIIDRVFTSGLKPARQPQVKERRPLVLLLSLPTGFLIGMIGALFGLGRLFL